MVVEVAALVLIFILKPATKKVFERRTRMGLNTFAVYRTDANHSKTLCEVNIRSLQRGRQKKSRVTVCFRADAHTLDRNTRSVRG